MNSGYDTAHRNRCLSGAIHSPSFIWDWQNHWACAAVNPVPSQLQLLTTVTGGRRTWKETSVTVLHTYFSALYTWMHIHTLFVPPFHTHTDKHTAAWTLKIRSWSCERERGGLLRWSMCVCVCVCLCLFFFFSRGGEGLHYRTSWEWRSSETRDEAHTTSSHTHSKQGSHSKQMPHRLK